MAQRYTSLKDYLIRQFGERVQKLTLDAGMTCPNRDGRVGTGGCIYCNDRGSGTGAHRMGLTIADQIRQGKAALSRRYGVSKFIAYFQSFTNTYAPLPVLDQLWTETLTDPDIVGMTVGTRPDCISEAVMERLADLARNRLIWLELGLQSAHDATLERINRGHGVAVFESAVREAHLRSLPVCAHIILGLPGETEAHMIETARFIARLGIAGVKLHLLYVARGTALADLHATGQYTPLTREAYIHLVCNVLAELPPDMIIHRLSADPHARELIAPLWPRQKTQNLGHIHQALIDRDIWQGKAMGAPRPPEADSTPGTQNP